MQDEYPAGTASIRGPLFLTYFRSGGQQFPATDGSDFRISQRGQYQPFSLSGQTGVL